MIQSIIVCSAEAKEIITGIPPILLMGKERLETCNVPKQKALPDQTSKLVGKLYETTVFMGGVHFT